ncbi:unnamed protein product [Polarella glacialis]|uniref:Uncharacterized protein n=1 Tax=Polarella glacialis TaxID=89957 RepID=A0A813DIU0_POLGL|nr:unnamed protein product [Polarella glacialis]
MAFVCCEADVTGTGAEEVFIETSAALNTTEEVAAVSTISEPLLIAEGIDQSLHGQVRRQVDNRVLGTLSNDGMKWDPSFKPEKTDFKQLDSTTMEMTIAGTVYTGSLGKGEGATTIVTWSDGETWLVQQ